MLKESQIKMMLLMQNNANQTVDKNWVELGHDWLLAASMELAEAIDHYGWKWWKAQETDIEQVQMELVDIWHFFLSEIIERDKELSFSDIAIRISASLSSPVNFIDFDDEAVFYQTLPVVTKMKLLMSMCANSRYDLPLFMEICEEVGLTQESLYKQYVGKNILNKFRQANGYKEGTYDKTWGDEEDNVVLVRILNSLDETDPKFIDNLEEELFVSYVHSH